MMISREVFAQAGEELYRQLADGMDGVNEQNRAVKFFLNRSNGYVDVEPIDKPPYAYEIGLNSLIAGLAMGIAVNRGERLPPTLTDEIDTLVVATLIPFRRSQAQFLLDRAVDKVDESIRTGGNAAFLGHIPPYVQAGADHVLAERSARFADTAFDLSYTRYEELAKSYEEARS